MKATALLIFLLGVSGARAQHVVSPKASLVSVAARQAALAGSTDPEMQEAIRELHSCAALPPVPAPTGQMEIPHHYLSGSHGPTNPAEAAATAVYNAFERRITAGMNQYVATGSHTESACALAQLDSWAQAHSLTDYDPRESSQAWYQAEWTLSSAGVTESVLVNDSTLDPAQQKRVIAWLDTAARRLISWEKPNDSGNNHHDWRALAAISIGIVATDDKLFQFGVETYKQAIGQLDERGALPLEMARHERAIHYQGFALEPLVVIAALAEPQNVNLYGYQVHGRTIRDAIIFFGRAVQDPSIVKPYTSDEQLVDYTRNDFAALAFYVARFGPTGMPSTITDALAKPTTSSRIGGCTTILAAK
jgi:poly(beta-D-mannuronate) lyase